MSFQCLDPYVAVSYFTKANGKKHLKLYSKSRLNYSLNELKDHYGDDNVFLLNCGKCESCRRNKAEDWAIRCELEAKCHSFNYFLTLTFDDFHVKKASSDDLKKFIDRLEGFEHKRKFKYFACQEFGELTHRIHFHIVLFCDFPIDLYEPIKIGSFYHYKSDLISDIWKNGFFTICPFETSCARYVAKYTAKDSKLFMSRNIGKQYFEQHFEEIIDDGFIVYSDFGGKMSAYVPQCFIRWFDEIDPSICEEHKNFKKGISHLVFRFKQRDIVSLHDEEVIYNDKMKVLNSLKGVRSL